MITTFRSLMVASLLAASSVYANPFAVAVGETKVITLSQRVSAVDVGDKGLVEVTRMPKGTAVVVRGRELGKTDLTLHTYGGGVVTLTLNITSDGARTFTVDRRATRMTLSTPELETESVSEPSAQVNPSTDSSENAIAAAD